jgi:hypothetical protein
MNNTRRTGIVVLLASVLAVIGMSSSSLASPSKASPQVARSAPKNNCPDVADFEDALREYRQNEQILRERIDYLEGTQRDLQEKLQQFRFPLPQPSSPPQLTPLPKPKSGTSFDWMLAGAAIFALALCVIFLLRINRPKVTSESWMQGRPTDSGEIFSPSTIGLSPAPPTEIGIDPRLAHPSVSILPDWDSASPALDPQSLKNLLPERNARNRDSTIELAEIMLSFGRINSAAEALANFIENYPKEAFAPWLKLLEVYRANGQRTEFDKIAQKLNKTFNVWMVDWDNFTGALAPVHGLETMPHIVERLQKLWGTRECQAYLQHLLCDTRDETRRGFPLAAIEDILCLNDILEHYLGPYTGPVNAFDSDSQDIAPMTEVEGDKPEPHASAEENNAECRGE